MKLYLSLFNLIWEYFSESSKKRTIRKRVTTYFQFVELIRYPQYNATKEFLFSNCFFSQLTRVIIVFVILSVCENSFKLLNVMMRIVDIEQTRSIKTYINASIEYIWPMMFFTDLLQFKSIN